MHSHSSYWSKSPKWWDGYVTKLQSQICGIRAKIRKVLNQSEMYQQQNSGDCQGAEHKSGLQEEEGPHCQTAFVLHDHLKQWRIWICHIPDGHGTRQQSFSRWEGVLTDLRHGLLGAVAFFHESKGWYREEKAFGFISFSAQAMHLMSPHLIHMWLRMTNKMFPTVTEVRAGRFWTKKPRMDVMSLIGYHFDSLRMGETLPA